MVGHRIDNMLLNYYGPEMYDRYTSVYDPTGLGAAYQTQSDSQLTDWTDEDVIRAYLVSQQEAQERLYLQQQAELAQNNNYYQHLAGYRSFGGEWWQVFHQSKIPVTVIFILWSTSSSISPVYK